jgi:hypothetical protein
VIVVVAPSTLLPSPGSNWSPSTPAPAVTGVARPGVAVTTALATAPEARLPRSQMIRFDARAQVGGPGTEDTKVRPVPRTTVPVTPVAGSGPLLVAAMV